MSEKIKAYSLSFFIHLCFILFFSYFLSSSIILSKQKYLEIDLSLYDLGKDGEKGENKGIEQAKKTIPSKGKNFSKNVSSEKLYYSEKAFKVKPEESKVDETLSHSKAEVTEKGNDVLAKGKETGNELRHGGDGKEGSGKGSGKGGEGRGIGEGQGTGITKPEELYLHSKLGIISKIVQKHISYPYLARKMGWEGKVIISFLLTKEGKVSNFLIEKSSSYEILDQNAIETVKKCAKLFPLPPVDVKIKLPIIYQLN